MVVSSAMRIGTQEIMFRTGMVTPVGAAEREIGSGSKTATNADQTVALEAGSDKSVTKGPPSPKAAGGTNGKPSGVNKVNKQVAKPSAVTKSAGNSKNATSRRSTANGRSPVAGRPTANGKKTAGGDSESELVPVPKEHPRSRSKRTRKAR